MVPYGFLCSAESECKPEMSKLVLIHSLRTLLVVAMIIVNICFGSVGGLLILKEKANSKNKMASKWDVKSDVYNKLARKDRLNPASIYDHVVGYFWLFWLLKNGCLGMYQYFL